MDIKSEPWKTLVLSNILDFRFPQNFAKCCDSFRFVSQLQALNESPQYGFAWKFYSSVIFECLTMFRLFCY